MTSIEHEALLTNIIKLAKDYQYALEKEGFPRLDDLHQALEEVEEIARKHLKDAVWDAYIREKNI